MTDRSRPRVSRETRLLLGIVVVSLGVLWALARLRFPDQPSRPDPVGPVMAQFAPVSPFDAIAAAVAALERSVAPSLTRVTLTPHASDPTLRSVDRLAIGVAADAAVLVMPPGERPFRSSPSVVPLAPRSGLAVVRDATAPLITSVAWERAPVPSARFVIAAEAAVEGVSFRPVFIGAFAPIDDARWPGGVWRLPASAALTDGALLFTEQGLFLGAVVSRAGERTLVPAATLAQMSRTIPEPATPTRGVLGIAVQELTTLVADAIGVGHGVVVTWVDPKGPAAGLLHPLDVIDAVWGQPIDTREQWDAAIEQLEAGDGFDVRVHRAGMEPSTLTVTATAAPSPLQPAPLGAGLRSRARVGVEIVRVDPGGAAAHAGLTAGDVITAIGGLSSPTPANLQRLYTDAPADRPIAVAVTRGAAHLVLALEKTW